MSTPHIDTVKDLYARWIVEEDEVHIWRFDREGRIRRFAHKVDSHRHWLAYPGELTPPPTRPTGMFTDS
jgi:hypothetical protein